MTVGVSIRVQTEDFSLDGEWAALRRRVGGDCGAIVAFAGLVRDNARSGERTDTLLLEHYPGMTEASIAKIVAAAEARWPLDEVVVVHRVGVLRPADQIVLVLVASGHRAAAFAGCEFLMDHLKTQAVFWKKEVRQSGATWVRSSTDDGDRAAAWRRADTHR